ncbi:hypothetical protein SPRG_14372 [Saprolegnia parasitica CBS 223.65]|uniref:Uncharacterized protein n=1 Tax=Saprolegnia parasitica (strain CBS 223.65) TaxID=695850 RepID=A0A067BPJ3_SAPPC|nr:hypothetical protein SPRG_14372 [Saprolegnia parasitica CBS 223.65]KDO20434.1 hypothetical protein SPRG_14372 [Saprolegnia parasitica CBS 223.65]|eukprot:XP_012208890.1 hypothetical protein SPRG_14372 [Saprolegnia parasitica CBS 223.65]
MTVGTAVPIDGAPTSADPPLLGAIETSPLPPLQLRRTPSEKMVNGSQTRLPQVTPRVVGTPKEVTVKRRVQSAYVQRDVPLNQTHDVAPSVVTKVPSPSKVSPSKARIKSLERIVTYKQAEKTEKEAAEQSRVQRERLAQAQRDHALAQKQRRRAEIYAINAQMRAFNQAAMANGGSSSTPVGV